MDKYAFGNYLTALRTERGLSQSELGAIVGVSNKAISKWENGEALPRLERLKALADYFGVPVEELVNGSGGKTGEDQPRAEAVQKPQYKPQPSPLMDGENPEEYLRRIAAEAALEKKREIWGRRWTKIMLIADFVMIWAWGLPYILLTYLAFDIPIPDSGIVIGLVLLLVVTTFIAALVNLVVWNGYKWMRWLKIASSAYSLFNALTSFSSLYETIRLTPAWYAWILYLAILVELTYSIANIYLFAFYRPVKDFLEERSWYRKL